jgi:hypothetical protein
MNSAYLIANNSTRPAGTTVAEKKTYDNRQIVARSNVMIPILWLALYEQEDLLAFQSCDGDVLSPSITLRNARRNWARRKSRLEASFPHNLTELEGWEQGISRLEARYIKIDAGELWTLGPPSEFETRLRAAVRWFDRGGERDFDLLLDSLWMRGGYDPATKSLTQDNVPYYFYGEPWKLPPLEAGRGV